MVKNDFPFFKEQLSCLYLDNAATTQRPYVVIEVMHDYYKKNGANIGRGIYKKAETATALYEQSRLKVAQFINTLSAQDIIFTHGATDGINLVARGVGHLIQKGDSIVVTQLEHHSNFVPWQKLAEKTGAEFCVIPVTKEGFLDETTFDVHITERTKIVAVTHVSNALGVVNFHLNALIKKAHAAGALVLVDGAQYVGYNTLDVQALGADFYVFSGHKVLGPTGCGVLYVKPEVQPLIEPTSFGGGAVEVVSEKQTILARFPQCFEPGTPPIAEIVGLAAALEYLQKYGLDKVKKHTIKLTKHFIEEASKIEGVHILGPQEHLKEHAHIVSFIVDRMHAHDVAAFFDAQGISVRAGHHCAQPLAKVLGYQASIRLSFHIYNNAHDVDAVLDCLRHLTTSG